MASAEFNEHRLGIVGAGKLGTALARAALDANYEVFISGSGPAERVALIVDVLAHGAVVMTTSDVVAQSDVIVLAVPVHRFRELPRDLFDGKILIDAMNYWYEIDGDIDDMANAPHGTSVVVQEWFAGARVVKSLNQLGYHEVEEYRRERGEEGRIGVAIAGNDEEAVAIVTQIVDDLGFDPIQAGSLEAGVALQTDGVAFGVALNVHDLAALLSPFATNS